MLIRGNLYSTNFSMCEEKTLAMMEQISIDIDIDKMSIQHRHQVQASRNWDWDESRLELGRFEDLAWFAYRNTNNRGRHGEPGRCSIDRMVGKGGLAVRVDDGVNPRWGIDSSKASVTQQHQTSKLHHSGARRLAIERCCSHVTARSGEQSFCLAPVVLQSCQDSRICRSALFISTRRRVFSVFLTTPRIRVGKGQLHCGS